MACEILVIMTGHFGPTQAMATVALMYAFYFDGVFGFAF